MEYNDTERVSLFYFSTPLSIPLIDLFSYDFKLSRNPPLVAFAALPPPLPPIDELTSVR